MAFPSEIRIKTMTSTADATISMMTMSFFNTGSFMKNRISIQARDADSIKSGRIPAMPWNSMGTVPDVKALPISRAFIISICMPYPPRTMKMAYMTRKLMHEIASARVGSNAPTPYMG